MELFLAIVHGQTREAMVAHGILLAKNEFCVMYQNTAMSEIFESEWLLKYLQDDRLLSNLGFKSLTNIQLVAGYCCLKQLSSAFSLPEFSCH